MKKSTYIFLASLVAFASCQKSNVENEETTVEPLVFKASIVQDDSKTVLEMSGGSAKVLWESTDKIKVSNAIGQTAVYKLTAGAGTTSATFEYESGTVIAPSGSYSATYGSMPSTSQEYSANASVPLYMTAPSTDDPSNLCFSAQCGVLCLTLTDATHKIMRVEVENAGGVTYALTATEAVSIASGAKFYIALPADGYNMLRIYDDNDQVATKTPNPNLAVLKGHVKPASSSKLAFVDCTDVGFHGNHEWVRLWGSGYRFAKTNVGATKETDYGQYFAWGYGTGYAPNGINFSVSFDDTKFPSKAAENYADMAANTWGSGWYTPSKEIFTALKTNCDIFYISMNGVNGVKFTGKDSYASSYIFLPAAGYGYGSTLHENASQGWYWTSTPDNASASWNLILYHSTGNAEFANIYSKFWGFTVRAVRSE